MMGADSEIKKNLSSFLLELKDSEQITNLRLTNSNNSDVISRGGLVAAEGLVTVEGKTVTLQIWLDGRFPSSLPIIYLSPPSALGFIPHVNRAGYVCFAQTEGLLLNRRDPLGILEDAIERSVRVLASGLKGENEWDFVEEFESYWDDLPGTISISSLIDPNETIREVIAVVKEGGGQKEYILIGQDVTTIHSYFNNDKTKQYTHRKALYVPFKKGTYFKPPQPGKFWSAAEIRRITLANISSENSKKLPKLIKKSKREELVIFGLPKPSDGEVQFGILFKGVEHTHPLSKDGTASELKPIITKRKDKTFLLPRGGASQKLQNKQVAVIGCGAVGGFLIEDLVRSGVLNLMLIDYDVFTVENTFRHVLGRNYWGKHKAEALQEELKKKYPYVTIRTISDKAENALTSGIFEPAKWDLIIVAIGDDTTSLYLNELFNHKDGAPPILYTWLEAYGIGGHSLLTGNSRNKGCFECLFTPLPEVSNSQIYNRAAFAEPGQSFSKNISGCANRFTPYGSADAEKTAHLASRIAVQTLLNEIDGNILRSWKGNASDFLSAGFKLSQRYRLDEDDLNSDQVNFAAPNCLVCGNDK
jgi:molybdopterin/thiamine biosynthesis adenylyltransferase